MASSALWAATYWVGSSAACSGANVYATLDQALLVAFLNGDSSDEIRLTRTVAYTGNSNGSYTLNDWSSSGPGSLTLAGGYDDCFTAPSGKTLVGSSNFTVFEIGTSSQQTSEVTLRRLLVTGSGQHAITAGEGAFVALEDVEVSASNGGISVTAGAFVSIDAGSQIRDNYRTSSSGGGIACSGSSSSMEIAGTLFSNRTEFNGGNIHVGSGCFVDLLDGARITGAGPTGPFSALQGGGVYVGTDGQFRAGGRANRVIFDALLAHYGGGLSVDGGLAILENVHFNGNQVLSREGAAISVTGGGQLFMDRTADCELSGLRCSEIQGSVHRGSVVHVADSFVQIQRTLIERSVHDDLEPNVVAVGLVTGRDSTVRLNRVGFIDNEMYATVGTAGGIFQLSHLTIAGNRQPDGGAAYSFVNRGYSGSNLRVENSLVADTLGTDWFAGSFAAKCNLIGTADDRHPGSVWPVGSYSLGTPDFVNLPANDPHQLPSSDGVDMCLADTFPWSTDIDIDMNSAPVNESTNPQGLPGETGGLFDAGFDEVYGNIGPDEFLLTIEKEGSGAGVVISNPAGISCGSDCSEHYFNGTVVTLFAAPTGDGTFAGWLNCPLVNDDQECLTSLQSDQTIRAVFEAEDLIFADRFD